MDEKISDPEGGRNAVTVHERSVNSPQSLRINPKAQKRKLLHCEFKTRRIHSYSSPSPSSSSSSIPNYNSNDFSHGCCKLYLNCPDSTSRHSNIQLSVLAKRKNSLRKDDMMEKVAILKQICSPNEEDNDEKFLRKACADSDSTSRHNNIQLSVLAKRKNSRRKDDMTEKAAKSKQICSLNEEDDDEKFLRKACGADSGYGGKLELDCLNRYDNILSLLAKRKEDMTEEGAKSKQICSPNEEEDSEKFLRKASADSGYIGAKQDPDCLTSRYDNILSLPEKTTKSNQIRPPNEEDDEKSPQTACKGYDYGDEVYNLSCRIKNMKEKAKKKKTFSPNEEEDEKFLQNACTYSGYGDEVYNLSCLKENMLEKAERKQIYSLDDEEEYEKFQLKACTDSGYGDGVYNLSPLNENMKEKAEKKQIFSPNEEDDEKFLQNACTDSGYGDKVHNLSRLNKNMKEKAKKKKIFSPNEAEDQKFLQNACTDSGYGDKVYNLSHLNENMVEKAEKKLQIDSLDKEDDNEDEKFLQKARTNSGYGNKVYNLSHPNENATEKTEKRRIYSLNEEDDKEVVEKSLQKASRDPGYGGKLSFDELSALTKRTKDGTGKQLFPPAEGDEAILKACGRGSGYNRKCGLKFPYVRRIPAVFVMVNRDFIVASPVKQNLLLTLSLLKCGRNKKSENESRRQILIGRFTPFRSFLHFQLGRDASRVRTISNAGGSSTISESLSVEYFVRRFQASDIVTEMEVEYCSLNWKKVDYICTLYGKRVGVSVTRAMSYPDPKDFNAQMAQRLLYKKLFGLVVARHGVTKRHSFSQCILHMWCETQEIAKIIEKEYEGVSMDLDIADDVIMVLTVAEGWHSRPIFYESILKRVQP